MTGFYKRAYNELENQINELLIEQENQLASYEKIIAIIVQKLGKLKEYVLKTDFKNQQEEIHFFKHVKPQFIAKLIYYNAIYKIETKKPNDTKAVKKFVNEELRKLKRYFDNNLEFYKYYRTNNNFIDEKLLVRGKCDIKLNIDTYYFETDHRFSTSHDYKAAKIIANDLIQVYLEDQLNNGIQRKTADNSPLIWTANKASLTELIYALHSQGVFNNGNTDIIAIVRFFENSFNVDLGDFYHTFLELKGRKINRAKFIDSLRDALIKRMDEQDER